MPNACTHLKEKQENIRPEEIIGMYQWSTIYSGSKKLSILNIVIFAL
jgi:hypothetical protein